MDRLKHIFPEASAAARRQNLVDLAGTILIGPADAEVSSGMELRER
jgi:hypothetical protein